MTIKNILVTGATGYIGGRLVPRLLEKGYKVRCLARHQEHLNGKPWAQETEIIKGDILTGEGLNSAFRNIDAAFYLVHSMADTPNFEKSEEKSANNFIKVAKANDVKRIVYMGGLGDKSSKLSRHLKSRHRVGDILRSAGIKTTEFRAAIIVGSGSVSFEMIRYLVERLPIIPSFKYLQSYCQPTAIRDVLSYLINCLDKKETENKIIEIGGDSVHPYTDLLKIYAETRGLKRRFFNCYIWLPYSFSKFISFITPIPSMFAMPLLESLSNDVVCKNDDALKLFPEIKPLDYRTAVKYALMRISENAVETTWAMSVIPIQKKPYAFTDKEGMSAEERHIGISTTCDKVFKVFTGIGGKRGWFYA
ncbi:MAG: NAD(P)H-binding protein, partial [Elusimicrobia bacterium]|nr:NAD(P)H-binding protein [Elusimicrobiota bacterium]